MEDIDVVDYSEDPLEGVYIWRSSFPASVGLYSSGYSLVEPSQTHPVVLLDDQPTQPSLSTPPASPATLGFISACLNPNLGLDPLTTGTQARLITPPSVIVGTVGINPQASLAPPSDSFITVPPLAGTLPISADSLPPSLSNPSPPLVSSDPPLGQVQHPPPPQGTKKKYK